MTHLRVDHLNIFLTPGGGNFKKLISNYRRIMAVRCTKGEKEEELPSLIPP